VALENIVASQPARWLPPGYDNFNDVLTAASKKALKDAPEDLKTWKYGSVYPVVISHPVFSGLPILHGHMSVAAGVQPQSGGGYTVSRLAGASDRQNA